MMIRSFALVCINVSLFLYIPGYMNPQMYSRYDMSPASAPSMSSSPYLNGSYAMYTGSTTPVGSGSSSGGNSAGGHPPPQPPHNAPSPYNTMGSVSSVASSGSPTPP